jgi:hypothetical protein
VVVPSYGTTVYVVFSDADEDPLSFWWTLSDQGPVGDPQPLENPLGEGSAVTLVWNEELDGQILRCYVDDDQTDTVLIQWPLEVQ